LRVEGYPEFEKSPRSTSPAGMSPDAGTDAIEVYFTCVGCRLEGRVQGYLAYEKRHPPVGPP